MHFFPDRENTGSRFSYFSTFTSVHLYGNIDNKMKNIVAMIVLVLFTIVTTNCNLLRHCDSECKECRLIVKQISPILDSLYIADFHTKKWGVLRCEKSLFDTSYQITTVAKYYDKGNKIIVLVDTNRKVLGISHQFSGFD